MTLRLRYGAPATDGCIECLLVCSLHPTQCSWSGAAAEGGCIDYFTNVLRVRPLNVGENLSEYMMGETGA